MPRKTFRKGLWITAALLALYSIWIVIQILRFHPLPAAGISSDPLELVGIFHIHTTHSDGRKTVEQIAGLAARKGLDFLILADHGSPNRASLAERGWKQDVLVLAGTEISSSRGHLVGLGFSPDTTDLPGNAELAAVMMKDQGGLSVIAHPFSKTAWSWGEDVGYRGVEIINADTMLRKNFMRMLPWLPALPFRSALPLLKLLTPPENNLRRWDAWTRQARVFAYYGTDAHLLYGPLFDFLRLHVILERTPEAEFEKAEAQILEALAEGRFYNAVDAAADARGFRFWAEEGNNAIPMGAARPFSSAVSLHVRVPQVEGARSEILHNGRPLPPPSNPDMGTPAPGPGVYRVAVYLTYGSPLREDCPWILSNPIFLEERNHEHNR